MQPGELLYQCYPEAYWLEALYKNDDSVSAEVMAAFPRSLDVLFAALKHQKTSVRVAAARGLTGLLMLCTKPGLEPGTTVMEMELEPAKFSTAVEKAVPLLLDALEDEN